MKAAYNPYKNEGHTKTYFEPNYYNFVQKRVHEDNRIEKVCNDEIMEFEGILNPKNNYGEVTKILAIDCEFD